MNKNAIPFGQNSEISSGVRVDKISGRRYHTIGKDEESEGSTIVVLGIDPGYALMGWGVVEYNGGRMKLLGYGCVETRAGTPMQHRLRTLLMGVRDLVNIYHPDDVAFEELFFARNVTTALMVGAARGAAIIAATEYTENLYEYTPMQIKQAVTGYG